MTRLRDLERHLRDQGCLLRREIPPATARAICRQLGVSELDKR